MGSGRHFPVIAAMLAALVAIAVAAFAAWFYVGPNPRTASSTSGEPLVTVQIGGPFELTDHTGRAVTDRDFRGKYLLVFFGYAYCPDVCPTELQNIALALDELGPLASEVQPVFITVDPERDTVNLLADYVKHFHPRLVGLTGTPEQVAEAARGYRVFYAKVRDDKVADYLVDHSSFLYLMGPDGAFRTLLRGATPPARIAESVRSFIEGRG